MDNSDTVISAVNRIIFNFMVIVYNVKLNFRSRFIEDRLFREFCSTLFANRVVNPVDTNSRSHKSFYRINDLEN